MGTGQANVATLPASDQRGGTPVASSATTYPPGMIDLSSDFGARAARHLRGETVV
jgi:hypothetical protein